MSEQDRAHLNSLPPAVGLWLHDVCNRFEAAWRDGRRPRLEEYLGDASEPGRSPLLRELILLDVEYRRQQGEAAHANDYCLFFPTEPPDWLVRELAVCERAGRYRLEAEIGRGGMGVIYRAHDPDLDRTLAVKVLREHDRDHPEARDRFLKEAHITARLQHPNIPSVHEHGRLPDGRPFFAMKLIQGRTLSQLLSECPSAAPELPRTLQVFVQVCQAVAYAHSQGVIHRDLKPSNVMVGAFGEVQVMDWGVAKLLGEQGRGEDRDPATDGVAEGRAGMIDAPTTCGPNHGTRPGAVMGSSRYMPPEQARGKVDLLGPRCDVFSLGAILCEILTGKPPYTGAPGEDVQEQAKAADLTAAWARLDGCGADAELVQLAKACLASDREARPADAGAVAAAVATFQAGVEARLRQAEVETAQARVQVREGRKRRRLRLVLSTSLLGLLLVGGRIGWLMHQRRVERDREVTAHLGRAGELLYQERWKEARKALEQAHERLGASAPEGLRQRLEQARRDLDLSFELDAIRLRKATLVEGKIFNVEETDREYEQTFRQAGLGVPLGEDAGAVAARVSAAPIKEQLVAALDDWAASTKDPKRRGWLLAVARQADPDPLRNRFRDPEGWASRPALSRLLEQAQNPAMSPQLVGAFAKRCCQAGMDPLPVLRAAQLRHHGDFWLNLYLADVLREYKKPEEAIGFYTTALRIRPDTAGVYNNLGNALRAVGDLEGAIVAHTKSLELHPQSAIAHTNLGNALYKKGDLPGAIASYHKALELDRTYALTYYNLGFAFRNKGDLSDSLTAFQKGEALGFPLAAQRVREAQRLIELDGKLPAIQRGDYTPPDAAECIEVARLCSIRKLPATAARLYEEAFAPERKLSYDVQVHNRYAAARAAALAAAGKGEDAAKLPDRRRADLRQRTLDWLQKDLTSWTKAAAIPDTHSRIREVLQSWQKDPDLASVRDEQLSEPEREAWKKLWAQVDQVLSRVSPARSLQPPPN